MGLKIRLFHELYVLTCIFQMLVIFDSFLFKPEKYSFHQYRVEDRLMNYLLASELFTKINHKPIDLH